MDNTNKQNIKMMFMYVVAFFTCMALVVALSVIFGMKQFSVLPSSSPFDRPAQSVSFHDHRL